MGQLIGMIIAGAIIGALARLFMNCLLYTSPSPRD